MQGGAIGQAIDGADLLALHLDGQRGARIRRASVDDHRAGAALATVADTLVAGQVGPVAQGVEQGHPRFNPQVEALAVDQQLDRHLTWPNHSPAGLCLCKRGFRHACDGCRQRTDARRLEETPMADVYALGLVWIVLMSHALALETNASTRNRGSILR